jgi:CubicO group peptidase (beta-lactamase class C family)
MRTVIAACVFMSLTRATLAQETPPPPPPPSLVAGYKALFTCSGTFVAGRSLEQITRNEFVGIYSGYEKAIAALPTPQIDRDKGTVSLTYDEKMPPRIARYREPLGCSLLPPGASDAAAVPTVEVSKKPDDLVDVPWPQGDYVAQAPVGSDARTPLGAVIAKAFDARTYGYSTRTSAVIIVAGGKLRGEAYAPDSGIDVPQRTWSVAKTLTGALIGIAIQDGLLKPEDQAGIPQWSASGDPRGSIRIIDLMHMMSGLDSSPAGNRTDEVYFGGGRVDDHSLTRELAAQPGTRWAYANNDTLALNYILRARLKDDARYLAFPYQRLFHPIGMWHTTAETDWTGNFILSSQVWTTARDLARFGILLLNDGLWNGTQILPKGWVAELGKPAPVQPPLTRADGTALPGYGKQVWLFGERHGLPEGTLAAMGNRGQHVVIVPARNVVIVRRGFDGEGARFAIDGFASDVLKVLQP